MIATETELQIFLLIGVVDIALVHGQGRQA